MCLAVIKAGLMMADEEIDGFHVLDFMADEVMKRIDGLLHQPSHQTFQASPNGKTKDRTKIKIEGKLCTLKKAARSWILSMADLTGAARDLVVTTELRKEKDGSSDRTRASNILLSCFLKEIEFVEAPFEEMESPSRRAISVALSRSLNEETHRRPREITDRGRRVPLIEREGSRQELCAWDQMRSAAVGRFSKACKGLRPQACEGRSVRKLDSKTTLHSPPSFTIRARLMADRSSSMS